MKAKHIQYWFMKGDIKNRETEEEAQWVYGCLFYPLMRVCFLQRLPRQSF